MSKGRVANVMAQGNSLDEVQVQAKRGANVFGHTRDELHVQAAARKVIVCTEREDLGLTG